MSKGPQDTTIFPAGRTGAQVAGLAGIGVAAAALAWSPPAHAQGTFQQQINAAAGIVCDSSTGPVCISQGAAGGPGGQIEAQNAGQPPGLEEHLRELQCKADKNANCIQPGGAAADSMPFEGLNLFVSTDYQNKDKEAGAEAAFNSNRAGFTVGLDSPMDWGVIGGALSYSHTVGDYDHNGGDFNIDSFGGLFYGSYYPSDNSFIDGAIGFAGKGHTLDRTVVADLGGGPQILGKARGDTIGFEFQSSVSGGYDFHFDNFTIGPRAGVHYLRTDLDSFTETGNALALHYDEQVEDSLTSTVGFQGSVAISTSFGVVVPQVSAEYVHEFLNDRRTIHAVTTDGTNTPVDFVTDPPDRDYLNVGGGVVFVLPDGISPFLNYSAELANRFEEIHTVTAGVRFEL
jgi:outer membrane autotransporter protein